jgi:antitoxin component YwqK of YwqJK toxin-antitoxin module
VTWWRDREAREEQTYKYGKRHGTWKTYASDGTLENECEYRLGQPWNGNCRIWKFKSFEAYFEDGIQISKKADDGARADDGGVH